MYVFVYGTLKKGYHNHDLLKDSVFIQDLVTPPIFEMKSVSASGGFPCLVEGDKAIHGEVYFCNKETLTNLDRLEGVPHMYQRRTFQSNLGDLKNVPISYYHWVRQTPPFNTGVHVSEEPFAQIWVNR